MPRKPTTAYTFRSAAPTDDASTCRERMPAGTTLSATPYGTCPAREPDVGCIQRRLLPGS